MFTREMTLTETQRLELAGGEAVLQMDEDTFRAFYDRTARPLWAYLSKITGDRSQADDLLQDAYYRFLRASATYESEAHRRNALFRIATNLARDAHRRAVLRPWLNKRESADVEVLEQTGTSGGLETRTDLNRAMRQLKPRDRALLWLAYAEGSSHREIATTLGLNAGSVKLMLFRARRKLSTILGREPVTDGSTR